MIQTSQLSTGRSAARLAMALTALAAVVGLGWAASRGTSADLEPLTAAVPDPESPCNDAASEVQVARLVYAGNKTSQCFSDHFLRQAASDSLITTSPQIHTVRLDSDDLYSYPLVIMTGEGQFSLLDLERENLRRFVERGGLLLASAGCSSSDWDRSFRREMSLVFPETQLGAIGMEHPVFHTVYDIDELTAKHGRPWPLEGIAIEGRLGVIYSQDGLNDTAHTHGCCCCGGNEITNSLVVNVNILAYALAY